MGCFKGEFKKMSIRDQDNVNTVNTKIKKDKHLQIRVSQEIKDRFQSYFLLIFFLILTPNTPYKIVY